MVLLEASQPRQYSKSKRSLPVLPAQIFAQTHRILPHERRSATEYRQSSQNAKNNWSGPASTEQQLWPELKKAPGVVEQRKVEYLIKSYHRRARVQQNLDQHLPARTRGPFHQAVI